MNPYLSGVLLAYTLFAIGLISPGPNAFAVMGASMSRGRGAGLSLAMGLGGGSFLWGVITVTGLATLLTTYAFALTVVKLFGALYFLWLAFKSFRSALAPIDADLSDLQWGEGEETRNRYFMSGLTIQMTNPKAALTWIAILSLAIQPNFPAWVALAIVIGCGLLSLIGYSAYAVVFSSSPVQVVYKRGRPWIEGALGCFFCFASYKLLTSRT